MKRAMVAAAVAFATVCGPYVGAGFSRPTSQQSDAPVRILIDQPARAVEYQLGRLTNDELARVERKDDDPRYRLVYVALLTRKGLARGFREEAVAALVKLDRATPTQVLLETLARIPQDDQPTADGLAAMALSQSAETLRGQRELLARTAGAADPTPALRAAYGGLMIADNASDAAWQAAAQRPGHLRELLNGVSLLPPGAALDQLRGRLAVSIAALITQQPATADADTRSAAVGALQRMPENAWPTGEVERLARATAALVKDMPVEQRTSPDATEAIQLSERLAASLPEPARAALLRDLRALGVRVVRVTAVPEQMKFDVNWFVVEAGKPVQIVLVNPDNMPHNLVLGKPGSLETLGTTAMTMPMPSDPAVKPYVPPGPLVIAATNLVNAGDTDRLNFTAPRELGEYPYACTFPGHWARMYGVMLVVENLEAWEAAQTTPTDPMTKRPFASRTSR